MPAKRRPARCPVFDSRLLATGVEHDRAESAGTAVLGYRARTRLSCLRRHLQRRSSLRLGALVLIRASSAGPSPITASRARGPAAGWVTGGRWPSRTGSLGDLLVHRADMPVLPGKLCGGLPTLAASAHGNALGRGDCHGACSGPSAGAWLYLAGGAAGRRFDRGLAAVSARAPISSPRIARWCSGLARARVSTFRQRSARAETSAALGIRGLGSAGQPHSLYSPR